MEEFKARKIIESLGSEAAEKGADAMTNEIIEDCCKANGVAPEDFRDFICENIDLQKLKELQGLEELSLKKLDQVAGGARPIKQGIASFLAATSLLSSATNFTGAAATGRHELPTLPRVNLSAETPQDRRREKPQRQKGHPWAGVAKAVGISSLIISAPYIAKWLLSPQKSDVPHFALAATYSGYKYQPISVQRGSAARTYNKTKLSENAQTQIQHLGLDFGTVKMNADDFFGSYYASRCQSAKKLTVFPHCLSDPRRGIATYTRDKVEPSSYNVKRDHLAEESKYVYNLGDDRCHVHDLTDKKPIQVTDWAGDAPIAHLWWCNMFSLPALFAINAALTNERRPGLKPATTAVQNAANAVSPGGDILKGTGTQEESLMMDTCAYAILNSVEAYKKYYLPNRDALYAERQSRNAELKHHYPQSTTPEDALSKTCMPDTCAVPSWKKTGIPTRVLYCPNVLLRNAKNNETINILTIAAPSWNPQHHGTYMGPRQANATTPEHFADNTRTAATDLIETTQSPTYKQLVIEYWNSALSAAFYEGARNLIFTRGGGGAFHGDQKLIDEALAEVLKSYGPSSDTCWARCFDHIGYAVNDQSVEKNLYNKYNHTNAPRTHIQKSSVKQNYIQCEHNWSDPSTGRPPSTSYILIDWLAT